MSKISLQDLWIILAGYLAAMHVGKLSPLLPILQNELQISFSQAGLSLSLVQAAGMLCALSIGAFAEKIGLKQCFIMGLLILGFSSMAGVWIEHVYLLYFLRFAEGLGFLSISVCAPALLKRLSKSQHLNFKMGLWSSYMGLGVSLAMVSIPWLLTVLSWQHIWFGLGLLCLILALLIHIFLNHVDDQIPSPKSTQGTFLKTIQTILKHPPIWYLAVIFACYTSQWITVVGFLPSMYINSAIDLKWAGLLTAGAVLANLVGTFGAGSLLQKGYEPEHLLRFGFICMLICSLLSFTAKSWLSFEWQYMSAVAFSMLGGVIPTTIFAITLYYAPYAHAAASSMGLVIQVSALAQFSVPPLSAALATDQGWSSIAWVTTGLCCGGLILSYLLFRAYPYTEKSQ